MQKRQAYLWLKMAMYYLIATNFLLDIICKNKNKHSYFGNPISDNLLNKKLESNDAELFCPVMFNFYHALEVIYKGIIQLHENKISEKSHVLTELFSKIQKITTISSEEKELLHCYIGDINNKLPEFDKWLLSNNLSIDNFYEFLKYPESKNGIKFLSFKFLGKEEETLPFYRNLRKDVVKLRKFIVSYYHETTRKGI